MTTVIDNRIRRFLHLSRNPFELLNYGDKMIDDKIDILIHDINQDPYHKIKSMHIP